MTVSVLICILIFMLSGQNGDSSGNLSEGFTRGILPDFLSDEVVYVIEKIIRKVAHYSIYFMLGISSLLSVDYFNKGYAGEEFKTSVIIFASVILCFLYSLTDELHQMYIPGRNGSFYDCLLDTFGAVSGIGIVYLIKYYLSHKKR